MEDRLNHTSGHFEQNCTTCKNKLGKINHLRCGGKKSHIFNKPVTNNYGCAYINK